MKIGLVYDAVYPWVKGGGEKHLWELALSLRSRGHEVHCFGMQFWAGGRSIERDGVWLHGVCRARQLYDSAGKRSLLQPAIFGFGLFITLFRNPAGKLDVIDSIVFPYFSVLAIGLWRMLTGANTAWVITWLEVWGAEYWRRYRGQGAAAGVGATMERLCARMGDRQVCISHHQARRLRELLAVSAERVAVISRGLDVNQVPPPAPVSARLLYLGRLLDYKNVAVVIRALQDVLPHFPAARLRIVGSGPEEAPLRALVAQLKLEAVIEFVAPKAEAADALREIAAAAVLVQPSTREGLSMVVLEAQAIGTPVVAALHADSAVTDLIEDGETGILVPEWDQPRAWSNAIVRVLTDETFSRRLAAAGKNAVRGFDWTSSIVPRVEQLYASLQSTPASRP